MVEPPPPIIYESNRGAALRSLTGYHRREPEKTVLFALVRESLEAMLQQARDASADGYSAAPRRQ
jgi:hypothetical protein